MPRSLGLSYRLDADEPLAARLADGYVLRLTNHVSRFAVAHPVDFRVRIWPDNFRLVTRADQERPRVLLAGRD